MSVLSCMTSAKPPLQRSPSPDLGIHVDYDKERKDNDDDVNIGMTLSGMTSSIFPSNTPDLGIPTRVKER